MDTAIFSDINWLAVLVAAVAYFFLGAIWYSALFSKAWIAGHAVNMNDPNIKKGTGAIMFMSFIWMFVASLALAILIHKMDMRAALPGAKLGLLTGVAFSAMAVSVSFLYLKKPTGIHFIDGLYHVVGQVIVGIILGVWR